MGAYIDDGYTLDGNLEADPDFDLEAVTFKYRPATAREVAAWTQGRDTIPGDAKGERDAKFIAAHVVEWSLEDRAGNSVPVNDKTAARLHPVLSTRLMDIISGYARSDGVSMETAKGN